jgi:hypothetical protein
MSRTSFETMLRGMNYLLYIGYAALVVFAIYRQFATGAVSVKSLVVMPALIAVGASQSFGHPGPDLSPVSLGFLVLNAVVGIAFGLWRGQTFAVWSVGGVAMRRGTWMTLWNWLGLVGFRVLAAVAAGFAGVASSQMTGDMLVSLFLTFAAQNLVIWMRAQAAAGRPLLSAAVR